MTVDDPLSYTFGGLVCVSAPDAKSSRRLLATAVLSRLTSSVALTREASWWFS